MKNKGKKKIVGIIAVAIVAILIVTGSLMAGVYTAFLKPSDFRDYVVCVSGDGTGYYRHCYEELNENEKKVYNIILNEIYDSPEKIEIPQLVDADLMRIFQAISYDNPDLINMGLNCKAFKNGYKTYFQVNYITDDATSKSQLDEAKNIAQVIIDGAAALTSEYDKEKYVHDYIINHSSYIESKESVNANNMYGCLVEGKASCEGYARAFQYIMNKLNIDNRLVTGEGASDGVNYIPHMWNYVDIEGKGYFVDVTWDDPVGSSNVMKHTYFNLTSNDVLLKYRNIEQLIPLVTDNTFNYFIKEECFSSVGSGIELETLLSNAVFTAIYRNEKSVEIRFPSGAIMQQAKNALFNEGIIYNVYTSAGLMVQGQQNAQVNYVDDPTMNTICLFF